MTMQADVTVARFFNVSHGGEIRENVPMGEVEGVLEELVTKYGAPPAPVVTECMAVQDVASPASQPSPTLALALTSQDAVGSQEVAQTSQRGAGHISQSGKARSEDDRTAALLAGFAPARPMYARGTKVTDDGVEKARSLRLEYDQKPSIGDACSALRTRIANEKREDVMIPSTSLFMTSAGTLIQETTKKRWQLEERAFKQLVNRLGLPAGAAPYLTECWPELRAKNINHWQQRAKEAEVLATAKARAKNQDVEQVQMCLRTREARTTEGRSVFAVVSDSYGDFDVDRLAEAIQQVMPENARASVHYDGFRAKVEVLFHSTVAPEDYVAGEFFRAGVVIKTDDTGGGAAKGWSVIEQNLCLNLTMTSKDAKPVFTVAHRHSRDEMARRISAGIREAEANLAHFLRQWGYARKDDLVAAAKARGELYEGMRATDIFAALANGVIERELVPVKGRRDIVIPQLVKAWEADVSSDGPARQGTVTRAALVNAFTRWAHETQDDPFGTVGVESSASSLLWPSSDRLRTLPTIPALPL